MAVHSSAKIYTQYFLHLYDFFVLWLSNNFAWKCSTGQTLLPFFQTHIGHIAHLDVGVGTGYYPSASVSYFNARSHPHITQVDLNPATLNFSKSRLRRNGFKGKINTLVHNVFEPLPNSMTGQFDSISIFYLFHCLPGAFPTKAYGVLDTLVPVLTEDGTLYGATVLGKGVRHNLFGAFLMWLWNKEGVFSNYSDSADDLRQALESRFEEVEVRTEGVVALFNARRPIHR